MDSSLVLSDPRCADPALAGAKAARLAIAHAAGLPVLPGIVVPVPASTGPLARARTLVTSRGAAAARLSIMDTSPAMLADLPRLAAELGHSLVVRSSSPLEHTGLWSGAFTSYLDVAPAEVATAVKGVWASALGEDVLGRLARTGSDSTGLAVLIQPALRPAFSGTARVATDDAVEVAVVAGPPARLTAGWDRGELARVTSDGQVTGAAAVALAGAGLLSRVADLALGVRRKLTDYTVEWAAVDGAVVLLQARNGAPVPSPVPATVDTQLPDNALAVARLVLRYAGPTGEALVLPWLLSGPAPVDVAPGFVASGFPTPGSVASGFVAPGFLDGDPLSAWSEAVDLAGALCPDGAERDVARLRDDPAPALQRLAGRTPVDAGQAAGILARLEVVARALAHADPLWTIPPEVVPRLLAGAAPRRTAPPAARWSGFVYRAVMAQGIRVAGDPAAPGRRVGPAHRLFTDVGRSTHTGEPPGVGTSASIYAPPVLVTHRPLPHFAPLLWDAAALVSTGGSPAAHLVEVARSLGVPAVVGCRLDGTPYEDGTLIAVDGYTGTVAVG